MGAVRSRPTRGSRRRTFVAPLSADPRKRSRRRTRGVSPAGPLRIAMLAPPWISIPPPGYGGVESVVDALTDALVARGHDVTLLLRSRFGLGRQGRNRAPRAPPRRDRAVDATRSTTSPGRSTRSTSPLADARFDVVHDHCGFTGARDGRPNRHSSRAHAARPLHARYGGFLRSSRAQGGAGGHKSRAARLGPPWSGAVRLDSRIRSTSARGRCRPRRTTTCCGSGG